MKIPQRLLKSGVNYSIASSFSAICSMIVGFLNMRWLGPELLGIWQSITIINSYLPIIQLGIQSGLNLELPILLGAGKKEKALEYVSTALSFAIFLSIIFSLVSVIAISIVAVNGSDEKIVWGVAVVAIMAILSCYRLHYIATYRSANAFDKLTVIYWIDSAVTLVLIYFIYKYQYFGLLIFHAVKDLFLTVLMYWFAPYRNIRPKFYMEHFKELLKRGVFMTVYNEIKGIIESLPRVILLKTGGVIQVGLFSPALVVGTFMNLIPAQIAQFLHPQMGMKYGQTKCARDMWPYFKALTIYIPLCLIPVALLGWWAIPYILEYVFPKYIDSMWPIRIMLIGFLFSTTFFSRGFMITLKAYKRVLLLQLIDFICFAGIPLLLIHFSKLGLLNSLATGLSISYFLTYFINITIVYRTIMLPKYNETQE